MTRPIIVVHGGAGDWPRNKQRAALDGVKMAAVAGWRIFQNRGSAIDATEAAVVSMEDNPIFNAGTGSALNLEGHVEMDAAIMDGRDLTGGAVAIVKRVKNPVRLARFVMEETDHVLLAGRKAERFAVACRVSRTNPRTVDRIRRWKKGLALFRKGRAHHLLRNYRLWRNSVLSGVDTVGALALDHEGNLVAACSTGGISLKLPGRIGDSAILGAGLYADNSVGAATATGIGELAVRTVISKTACDLMREYSPAVAARQCIRFVNRRMGRGLGILTLNARGTYGVAHDTRHLCWAVAEGSADARASIIGTRL